VAWVSEELIESESIFNPFGGSWHLDRVLFEETMREEVESISKMGSSGFQFRRGASVTRIESKEGEDRHKLVIGRREDEDAIDTKQDEDEAVTCSFLVDATGRTASIVKQVSQSNRWQRESSSDLSFFQMGATVIKEDHLLAFYAVFSSDTETTDNDRRTLIEAAPNGWWYSSKLPNQRRVVVYHTDDSDPTAKIAKRREGFMSLLQQTTVHVHCIIYSNHYSLETGYPKCTTAASTRLNPSCNPSRGWFATGDAVVAFDPLSSQGMITALEGGCVLGSILNRCFVNQTNKVEFSVDAVVADYEKWLEDVKTRYNSLKEYYYSQSRFAEPSNLQSTSSLGSTFWKKRRKEVIL